MKVPTHPAMFSLHTGTGRWDNKALEHTKAECKLRGKERGTENKRRVRKIRGKGTVMDTTLLAKRQTDLKAKVFTGSTVYCTRGREFLLYFSKTYCRVSTSLYPSLME